MIKKSVYKIPEGKLVKILLEEENGRIKTVKITGDFFMHPEEEIGILEQRLVGCKVRNEDLIKLVDNFWISEKVECFGITTKGLAEAILLAR